MALFWCWPLSFYAYYLLRINAINSERLLREAEKPACRRFEGPNGGFALEFAPVDRALLWHGAFGLDARGPEVKAIFTKRLVGGGLTKVI